MTDFEIEDSGDELKIGSEKLEFKITEEDGKTNVLAVTPQGFVEMKIGDEETSVNYLDHFETKIEGMAKQNPRVTVEYDGDRTEFESEDVSK